MGGEGSIARHSEGTYLEDDGLNDREDHELCRGRFSNHASIADEDGSGTKVSVHERSPINHWLVGWVRCEFCGEEDVDLHRKHRDDEREANGTHSIKLEESHEVAETNQHHQRNAHVHLIDGGVVLSVLAVE